MNIDYQKYVTDISDRFNAMLINVDYLSRIKQFASIVSNAKLSESHHQVDNNKECKRFTTGLMGEAAVEGLLGINIIDWTVGKSDKYNVADIPGYNVGIKTVEEGKFPIIFKKNDYSQIICIKSIREEYFNLVWVCGLATPSVLNKYQSEDLILDPKLRSRGTKTGFYGFEYLTKINSIEDIKRYKNQL